MTLELGPGLLALAGSVFTTLAGVFGLWLTQRNEFKKAAAQREYARLDAVAAADNIAATMKVNEASQVERLKRIIAGLVWNNPLTPEQAAEAKQVAEAQVPRDPKRAP